MVMVIACFVDVLDVGFLVCWRVGVLAICFSGGPMLRCSGACDPARLVRWFSGGLAMVMGLLVVNRTMQMVILLVVIRDLEMVLLLLAIFIRAMVILHGETIILANVLYSLVLGSVGLNVKNYTFNDG